MLVLSARDVEAVLTPAECIAAMERMFVGLARGEFFQPLRQRVRPEGSPNWLTVMPSLRHAGPRLWALKEMAVNPANTARGLDPIQGVVLLHDGDDGRLLAVVDAPALTAIRTAAVSALATRVLARPEAKRVAIVGAGVQGRAHIAAMRAVLPGASIVVWGRTRSRAEALAREHECDVADTIEHALRDADVVCTLTAASEPIVERAWFAAGAHVNAVGSSAPTTREIDPATIAAASFFVDRRESTVSESGDYLGALKAGAIAGPEHIRAELGEVLIGKHPGRTSTAELTLYKSLGLAIQDLAAAELATARARAAGRGVECAWA
jgi:ornithine cyclodeaminase/alanine dehydrogenase-like protein (mu-crystallin family)